uniref:Uncharacterized protein n=1 Tax=viral metagenome TaxID=1070528 RepID=A0A6C0JXG7_9ZZZZ
MSSPLSFYIPIISTSYMEDDIKQIFGQNVGKVTRVDFTSANSRPGQGKPGPAIIRSAYVYISCFYRTHLAENIERIVFGLKRGFRFTVAPREYWILLKNHKPIPSCDQNIHQLAERLRIAESIASSQQSQIDSLKQMNIAQVNYCDRMLDTVLELLKTSNSHLSDMPNVYSQYNYIRYNKCYSKRCLLHHNDDGDTINQSRMDDAEIDHDECSDSSTINTELIN